MGTRYITEEQARQFISAEDDFTGATDFPFYTRTLDGDGWDTVTYYTARKKTAFVNRDGEEDQWVYVMSNPTMSGVLKIGYTKNDPYERARQLSGATGVALPYKVEYAFKCFNGEQLEHEVHHRLTALRLNSHREFFQIELEQAIGAIEELGANYINNREEAQDA